MAAEPGRFAFATPVSRVSSCACCRLHGQLLRMRKVVVRERVPTVADTVASCTLVHNRCRQHAVLTPPLCAPVSQSGELARPYLLQDAESGDELTRNDSEVALCPSPAAGSHRRGRRSRRAASVDRAFVPASDHDSGAHTPALPTPAVSRRHVDTPVPATPSITSVPQVWSVSAHRRVPASHRHGGDAPGSHGSVDLSGCHTGGGKVGPTTWALPPLALPAVLPPIDLRGRRAVSQQSRRALCGASQHNLDNSIMALSGCVDVAVTLADPCGLDVELDPVCHATKSYQPLPGHGKLVAGASGRIGPRPPGRESQTAVYERPTGRRAHVDDDKPGLALAAGGSAFAA